MVGIMLCANKVCRPLRLKEPSPEFPPPITPQMDNQRYPASREKVLDLHVCRKKSVIRIDDVRFEFFYGRPKSCISEKFFPKFGSRCGFYGFRERCEYVACNAR